MVKKQYDIFISYSRQDMAVADKICAALDNAGITYFIDRQGIGGGMEFPEVLAENIISSKLFLFLASKHSYGSKFTNNEITFAFNEKPKNTILPYIVDGSHMPKAMRFIFSGINWRTIDEHPIEPTLINDLLNLLGKNRETLQPKFFKETYNSINNTESIVIPHGKRKYIWTLALFVSVVSGYFIVTRIIIGLRYDNMYGWNEGLAMVDLNNKIGFVNKFGKEVVPIIYDDCCLFQDGCALVGLNGKYGYVNKHGKMVIPLKYDDGQPFRKGLALVELNGKVGYIDRNDNEIVPLKYDDIAGSFTEGLAPCKLSGKWGFVDITGKETIPLEFDAVDFFSEGLAAVKFNNKWGYIDKNTHVVIPYDYDFAGGFVNGKAMVKLRGESFYIDKNGNKIE